MEDSTIDMGSYFGKGRSNKTDLRENGLESITEEPYKSARPPKVNKRVANIASGGGSAFSANLSMIGHKGNRKNQTV